jgi:hypothetical protein
MAVNEISFTVQFRVTPKTLEVEYVLKNMGRDDMYLVDIAVEMDSVNNIKIRPAVPRVDLSPPDTVVLSTKMLPLASNVLYPTPPDVYTSPLKASQVKQSMFSVPLPLQLTAAPVPAEQVVQKSNPQQAPQQPAAPQVHSAAPQGTQPKPTHRELNTQKLRLVIGAIEMAKGLKMTEQVVDDVPICRFTAADAIPHQKELVVESIVSPPVMAIVPLPG